MTQRYSGQDSRPYPNVRAITMSEVQDSCPVVRLVLHEPASRAGCQFGDIDAVIHGEVEGILKDTVRIGSVYSTAGLTHSTDDLM